MEEIKYTLLIDRILFKKFRYVADWDGRSANRELEVLVERYIKSYESKNGDIKPEIEY